MVMAPAWLVKAASYLGFHEVGDNQGIEKFIEDAHAGELGNPWCAIFANACLEESGVPGTRSAAARSFERSSNFVRLTQPALGCIVTRWRGSPTGGQGHVYFYTGENENGIVAIAGNEGDAVRRYYEPKGPITGYWWPAKAALPTGGPLRLPVEMALQRAAWEGTPQDVPATAPSAKPTQVGRMFSATGKCSTFGGPADDTGMKPDEGLALFASKAQMEQHDAGDLLLANSAFSGLGRSLNPLKYYVACRWDYAETPVSTLRDAAALVTANGKSALARPVDWGPNARTGRVADLSPGLATFLGVGTDDIVSVTFPAPEEQTMPDITPDIKPAPDIRPDIPATDILGGVVKRIEALLGRVIEHQMEAILARIEQIVPQPGAPVPPAPGAVTYVPTKPGATSMFGAAALLPWLMSVLPQIGTLLVPVLTGLMSTGVVGTATGPAATPTGQTLTAGVASTIGIGIFNWIKQKWFTPPATQADTPPAAGSA